MSKINKSLSELDALADDILSKSVKPEDDKEDLKPEDISDSAPTDDTPTDDTQKPEDKTDEKEPEGEAEKDEPEDANDDEPEDDVKKSEEPEDIESEDELEEDVKKSEDVEPEDEEDNEDESIEDEDESEVKDDLEKSIKSDFTADDNIKNGMDASEFLSSCVEVISKSLADVQCELHYSGKDAKEHNTILAKSLQASLSLNKSMAAEIAEIKKENAELRKSITDGFTAIQDSLNGVLSQPVGMRKSVNNINVIDKNFQKSLNGNSGSSIDNLSKSQILDILHTELVGGNAAVTTEDIISYESGAPLRAGLASLIASKAR